MFQTWIKHLKIPMTFTLYREHNAKPLVENSCWIFNKTGHCSSPLSHRVRPCFCGRHFGSCSSRDEKKLQDQDHYQQVAADKHQLLATTPGDSTRGYQVLL